MGQQRMFSRRRAIPWLVPFAVGGLVLGGAAIATAGPSSGTPHLPGRSAEQLISAVIGSRPIPFSGQIHESVSLGLPSLPNTGATASLSLRDYLLGAHTVRVWSDGDKQRIAVIGQLSEADVVRNGPDLWTYVSDTNTASHSTLTGHGSQEQQPPTSPATLTPTQLADRLLSAVDPSTAVSVGTPRMVAGRDAYALVLRPRDSSSTVRQIVVALDAKTMLPLAVQLYGSGATPAFDTHFTSVSFGTPDASTFHFTTPKGATVTADPFGLSDRGGYQSDEAHAAPPPAESATPSRTRVLGSGWTTVLETSAGAGLSAVPGIGSFGRFTTAVGSSGTRLLHTALVNVVIRPDGMAFVGAVTPSALERIAASTP